MTLEFRANSEPVELDRIRRSGTPSIGADIHRPELTGWLQRDAYPVLSKHRDSRCSAITSFHHRVRQLQCWPRRLDMVAGNELYFLADPPSGRTRRIGAGSHAGVW